MGRSLVKYLLVGVSSALLFSIVVRGNAKERNRSPNVLSRYNPSIASDTPNPDDTPVVLPYEFKDEPSENPIENPQNGGLSLNEPDNVETIIEYDPITGNYYVTKKIGDSYFRTPTYMTSEEYQEYMRKKQMADYWDARSKADSKSEANDNAVAPKLNVGGEIFDRIFGGNTVAIEPNGSAELILGYSGTKTENPAIPERNRRVGSLNFDEKIQLNVVGKIGDKLKLTTSYNTEATFDFENQMKLNYTGYKDEIIQSIEAGNVSFPLNSSLISGSQTLFGVKTELQFGRLTVTSVISQEKGTTSEVEVKGGAQTQSYEIRADSYDENRHFFLSHFFRDQYNTALAGLPFVNSQVNITRIEVWVTNTNTATNDIRSIVAFAELGEDISHIPVDQQTFITDLSSTTLPFNGQNNLDTLLKSNSGVRSISTTISSINSLSGNAMNQQTNYEQIASARKLSPSEFTLNPLLGYISLRQKLTPAQAMSVAFQYTYNGQVFQVGEFSDGGISAPDALYTKMLKSTATNTNHPMWDLMMKNIYSMGAYQVSPDDFRMDVFYTNKATGTDINYLPVTSCHTDVHEKPLIQVLNVDRLNQQNDNKPDGLFDFIDGVTILSKNGLIIFPVVEPFGNHLSSKFTTTCSSTDAAEYAFPQLYDSTKVIAQQFFPQLNRFVIKGTYQSSSSSEISLGSPNVAQGSVIVTAGGITLTENVDYTVDYTLGRVKIINEGILNSGTPIKVKSGSNSFFNQQQKRLLASHFNYRVNNDFNVGATIMNLTERPINNKVNIGFEPVSNTIVGLNANYSTEAPILTRMVDKLPFIDTKTMSTITARGEFAYLIPGHNKAIGDDGNSYIDDFESTQSTIDLRSQSSWVLASTPQGQPTVFPEGELFDSLAYGFNRAKLAWYVISPELLVKTDNTTPSNLTDADLSNNFTREVLETEVFPNRELSNGVPQNISVLDLAYYPSEVGPYNYDATPTSVSDGIDANGNLIDPASRWGGIMRSLQTTDFQSTNVEFIQFWIMDPFNEDNPATDWNSSGELYIHLGNISEDILRDGQRSSENALPTPITAATTLTTAWGQVPEVQPLLTTFNNDPDERPYQDVGLDGLANTLSIDGSPTEQSYFSSYLSTVESILSANAFSEFSLDPSHDDFHYFRGTDYDNLDLKILDRYKQFNGYENNSRTTEQSPESYPTQSSLSPNVEDINQDNNLSTAESYFQYHIGLKPSDFSAGVGSNYITNVLTTTGVNIKDGTTKPIKWYQFKIPVKQPEKVIGSIDNFQSIRFIRMYFKNVDKPIVLRLARFELIRSEWRKYELDLSQPGIYIPSDDDNTTFDVSAVNLEENSGKEPVNYVLPPNITRQITFGTSNPLQQNEQSIALTVCNLEDGEARAAFKNTDLDVRSFKKIEMFIHGEALTEAINDDDLNVFIRLGTDYTDNYYEYAIPLKITAPGFYNGDSETDQFIVWPEANNMELEFDKLIAAKIARNKANGDNSLEEYIVSDGAKTIKVKGNPNLGAIKTLMIGIRNPKSSGAGDADDGLSKCAAVWINELRLTEFVEEGGGAANASVEAKLADLGSLSASGNYYAPGFGSVEDKVSERKRETLKQYNLNSSLELGKFLPESSGIKVPMYAGYGETFITPQFNPLSPDIELADQLKELPKTERKELKELTQDYTEQKSINFSNVSKSKGKNASKSHIYDIENWSASYAYSQQVKRNINLEYDTTRNYKGGLTYSYSPKPKNIRPFSKYKFLKSKHLSLIRDVNFFLYPNQLGFSTEVLRNYNTSRYRDITQTDMKIPATFNKRIDWTRNYNLRFPITRALKVDYTASNIARVREPDGRIVTKEQKDSILNNFKNLGETTQFNSQFGANYKIPINKVPFLGFTKASVKYTGTYVWQRHPFNADSLGNTIENSQVIAWNGSLNFNKLYNKVPYLRKINSRRAKKPKSNSDSTKSLNINPMAPVEVLARLATSVKNINATYSTNRGTLLPGYKQQTTMLGMDDQFAGPTTGFVLGHQGDIRNKAIANDWLVKTPSINTPYTTSYTQKLSIRANLKPLRDFRVEITESRSLSSSYSEFFRWNDTSSSFVSQSPMEMGSFSMSFLSYRTTFNSGDKNLKNFINAREIVSERLGSENPNSTTSYDNYAEGYNKTSQDVLLPSFLAAYSGRNPNNITLENFPKIPLPNWRVTYTGLSKIKAIRKVFRTMTLTHAYKSTYSIAGYSTNLLYNEDENGNANSKQPESSISNNPNFQTQYLITSVAIIEQWSPLIKVNMVLRNSISGNLEFKKDRNVSLGITSKTITEVNGQEIVIGGGYQLKNVSLGKKLKIKGKKIQSNVNLLANLSFRNNVTVIHRIEEDNSQTTAGTNIISLKLSADYTVNQKLSVRLFYDRIINKPKISNSFPTANTNAGVSIRLSLAN